jgi:hypothetical protein
MRKTTALTAAILLALAASAAAQSGELLDTKVEKFGYALVIPREFSLKGPVTETTAWTSPPDTAVAAPGAAGETGAALTIWVNRVPVETKNLAGLYEVGRRYDADIAKGPGATIHDVRDLTLEGGYGYWYKEADKGSPAANHRWIARVFGNGAVYTICVAGPFGEFGTWGPAFEQVIASFRLVPTKAR